MSKFCPAINQQVLYMTCLECDDKVCKKGKNIENDVISKHDTSLEEERIAKNERRNNT